MRRALIALALGIAGCGEPRQWAFVEDADVRMDVPNMPAAQGQVRNVAAQSVLDLDRAVGEAALTFADVAAFVAERRETERRGDWRIFGPFDDPSGRDLSWTVEFFGGSQGSRFAFDVAAGRGSSPSLRVLEGEVELDDGRRTGQLVIDLGALFELPDVRSDAAESFVGSVELDFTRDGNGHDLQMQLDGFVAGRVGEPSWSSSGPLRFESSSEGSGAVALDVVRAPEDPLASATAARRFEVALQWKPDAQQHARAVAHSQQPEDTQAPAMGPLVVDECFGQDGQLVYGDVSEPYRDALAQFVQGDRQRCAFSDAELGRT